MKKIRHKFHNEPIPTWVCKTLILGSFNPEIGSDADYYYGRLRSKGGWSNRFWPAVNSYLAANFQEIPHAERGVLDSKVGIMTKFKFGCVDIISRVECVNVDNIIGNGFPDSAIFDPLNKVYFNTELIIDYINSNGIKKVISSFGKGTSLNQSTLYEIDNIINSCSKADFHLFELPAFGRPLMSTERFGKELFKFIL